jgi:reverse gyrase
MSLDNIRTGFATNWFRTTVDVMQPKEIGFVHPPRKWQSECFETIASNNPISIINAPTGSGKSTMLSMLAYQRTVSDNKKKTIIAVPQTVIGKGFNTKVFKLPDGQVIDWSVGVDLCTNAKDTVEQFTNFISLKYSLIY